MRKNVKKLISFVLCFLMFLFVSHVFAGESNEEISIITKIISTALNAILWVAYAIALGCLLFFGIKYVLSGANDKAKIKGVLPQYLIGLGLIVCSFTIAAWVADAIGNDNAEEIIGVANNAGNHFVVSVPISSDDEETGLTPELEAFYEWMQEYDPAFQNIQNYETSPYNKTECPVTRRRACS